MTANPQNSATLDAPDRLVGSRMTIRSTGDTAYVLAVAVAQGHLLTEERLELTLEGAPVPHTEQSDEHGGRLQLFGAGAGELIVDYSARIGNRPMPAAVEPLDAVRYVRPSRYCESDTLTPFARERFGSLAGAELAFAVTEWVHEQLSYVPGGGATRGGAIATLDAKQGVCRDYAHVVVALLRALDMPARTVGVYAPGLEPMDFHAVVEAMIEGRWYLFDATRLAPRRGMLRIATGRDAADTAFLSNTISDVELVELVVTADSDPLPVEDPGELVELA